MGIFHEFNDFEFSMPMFLLDKQVETATSDTQGGQFVMRMQMPGSPTMLTFDPAAYLFDFPSPESPVVIGDLDFTTEMFTAIYSKKFPGCRGSFTASVPLR